MMGEAADYEDALLRGDYDEPPEDDLWRGDYVPKRSRCFVCDALDWHERYVSVLAPGGKWIGAGADLYRR